MSAQKVAAYKRWSPTGGSNYTGFTEQVLVFGKVVAGWRSSPTRGGCIGRFNCIYFVYMAPQDYGFNTTHV